MMKIFFLPQNDPIESRIVENRPAELRYSFIHCFTPSIFRPYKNEKITKKKFKKAEKEKFFDATDFNLKIANRFNVVFPPFFFCSAPVKVCECG